MSTIHFLTNQIIETRNFTNRLISEMPEELWYEIPENTDANFAWQIGHLLTAQNYHINFCVFGMDRQVFDKIPLKSYAEVFGGLGSPKRSVSQDFVTTKELWKNMDYIFSICLGKLDNADEKMLGEELEPTLFKNPIAKNKYEAISWSFKHEMWHCAEMEQIKIRLGKQFNWLQ